MKNRGGKIKNTVLIVGALFVAVFGSSFLGNGTFFGAKIAFGYGGGGGGGYVPPTPLSAVGNSLTINATQEGTLTYTQGTGSVVLSVPKGAVSGTVTFSIVGSTVAGTEPTNGIVINPGTYIISAVDSSGNSVHDFSQPLTITFSGLNLPADISEVGVYYFDGTIRQWVLISGAIIDPASGTATFTVSHLTKFAVLEVEGRPLAVSAAEPLCAQGTLIKGSFSAVYYCGADGMRYVFPNEKTYKTWYADFSTVVKISDTNLANIPRGGNVTYRPGVRMVKMNTDPKVYAVSRGGVLHPIKDEATAVAIYGSSWNKMIDDIPEAFFTNYTIGSAINSTNDYNRDSAISSSVSINIDKGL